MTDFLDTGNPTTITLGSGPSASVVFKEKEVTPPSMEGGEAIDTTTMRNTAIRTKLPRRLKDLSDMSLLVSYDPEAYDDIWDMINVNQSITVNFPDDANVQFYGFLKSFKPNRMNDEQPTAEITITPTNVNSSTGAEAEPVYTT